MTSVQQFHNLSHIFISLVGAVLLMAIYYNIRKRFSTRLAEDDQTRVDHGLLYLSLSVFIWVISGLWAYLANLYLFESKTIFQLGVSLLSIANNMFLLMALFYFDHAPAFIYKNEKNVRIISILIVTITALTFGLFVFLRSDNSDFDFVSLPDLLLSGFLSILLMITFYRTFVARGLYVVALISILVIVLIFVSQLPQTFQILDNGFNNYLLMIIAKTSLISLFLVLATSWVIQLANTPIIKEMRLWIDDWSLIKLNIPSKNIHNETIDFGSKTTQFKNLLKLAIRRKYGTGNDQSMEIGAGREIKNQTYLTRIIENLNTILEIDEKDQLQRNDLFVFIGEGRYRLRILPNNIDIHQSLLKEFLEQEENKNYLRICN